MRPALPLSQAVLKRRLDLPEYLRLAEHHRIQAAGDAQQVANAFTIGVGVQVRRKQLRLDAVEAAQPVAQLGLVAACLERAIELGAVAGRQDHGLASRCLLGHRAQRPDDDIRSEG
jgi:hypothetical protein